MLGLTLLTATLSVGVPAEDALIPTKTMRKLESLAGRVANAGRADEVVDIIDVMLALGYPTADGADLVKECNGKLAKAKKGRPRKLTAEARTATSIAKSLLPLLDAAEPDDGQRIARQVIALDSEVEEAQRYLGREHVDGSWRAAGAEDRRHRRREITAALTRARDVDVPLTIEPARDELAIAICGEGTLVCRVGRTRFYQKGPESKLTRMVTETFRALAMTHYLLNGELAIPPIKLDTKWYSFTNRTDYDRALDVVEQRGLISAQKREQHAQLGGIFLSPTRCVSRSVTEADFETKMYAYLSLLASIGRKHRPIEEAQACLQRGLQNWVCYHYLGAKVPDWGWLETVARDLPHPGTFSGLLDEARRQEFEEMLRISKAGIVGGRSWLAYLAQNGQDPRWRQAMVDEPGDVIGEPLLKTTLVVEYLLEETDLLDLIVRTSPTRSGNEVIAIPELFERELGMPLAELERRWRDWLLPGADSIADRLRGGPSAGTSFTKSQLAALAAVNEVRRATLESIQHDEYRDLSLDAALSDGARKHALYLDRHPDQSASWPEAHEEFPDREGFSVEGAWAGGNSVIAPGVASPGEAIDAWLGTFYHRVPLLDPGLIRVGFGFEKRIAVLDTGSLVGTWNRQWRVVYPADDQRGVPRSFVPELPNPVPGEDQSRWGYPITVQSQYADYGEDNSSIMELRKGSASGALVDCHYSTPSQPTNPDLAPDGCFCLIPKSTLEPNTRYHVRFVTNDRETVWTFNTGS